MTEKFPAMLPGALFALKLI